MAHLKKTENKRESERGLSKIVLQCGALSLALVVQRPQLQ